MTSEDFRMGLLQDRHDSRECSACEERFDPEDMVGDVCRWCDAQCSCTPLIGGRHGRGCDLYDGWADR